MRRVTLLFAFAISVVFAKSQDYTKLINAFADSYAKEKAGKYVEAAAPLKANYDEKSYEINLRLGWLTYLQGNFSESLGYYNKAIDLMPYAIEPRLGIAFPASAQGNWDLVVTHYNKILSIDPNHTLTLYRMGAIAYERKDYHQAYKYVEKVVNLYPWDHSSVLLFAWINLQMGKTREAKILFNKVLLYFPDDASAKEGLKAIK